jgi:hypothetical protein
VKTIIIARKLLLLLAGRTRVDVRLHWMDRLPMLRSRLRHSAGQPQTAEAAQNNIRLQSEPPPGDGGERPGLGTGPLHRVRHAKFRQERRPACLPGRKRHKSAVV